MVAGTRPQGKTKVHSITRQIAPGGSSAMIALCHVSSDGVH